MIVIRIEERSWNTPKHACNTKTANFQLNTSSTVGKILTLLRYVRSKKRDQKLWVRLTYEYYQCCHSVDSSINTALLAYSDLTYPHITMQ